MRCPKCAHDPQNSCDPCIERAYSRFVAIDRGMISCDNCRRAARMTCSACKNGSKFEALPDAPSA